MSHHGRSGAARSAPYHAVWHTTEHVPSLRRGKIFRQLGESFRRCHEKYGFRVVHFCVQSNHVHALVEADRVEAFSRGMQGLGVSMAKRINRVTGRRGHVFDDRFYARVLRSPREVANAVDYVLSGLSSAVLSAQDQRKFSLVYARCTRGYFAALAAQLRPMKRRLIERNRELLERFAAQLAALGYVP